MGAGARIEPLPKRSWSHSPARRGEAGSLGEPWPPHLSVRPLSSLPLSPTPAQPPSPTYRHMHAFICVFVAGVNSACNAVIAGRLQQQQGGRGVRAAHSLAMGSGGVMRLLCKEQMRMAQGRGRYAAHFGGLSAL